MSKVLSFESWELKTTEAKHSDKGFQLKCNFSAENMSVDRTIEQKGSGMID